MEEEGGGLRTHKEVKERAGWGGGWPSGGHSQRIQRANVNPRVEGQKTELAPEWRVLSTQRRQWGEDDNRHTCTNSLSPRSIHFRLRFLYSTTETNVASQLNTNCNSSLPWGFQKTPLCSVYIQRRLLKVRCRGLPDFLAETVPHSADCPPFFSPGTSFFSSSSPANPQEPIHTLLIAPLKIHLLSGKIRAQERRRFLKTALFEAKQL